MADHCNKRNHFHGCDCDAKIVRIAEYQSFELVAVVYFCDECGCELYLIEEAKNETQNL